MEPRLESSRYRQATPIKIEGEGSKLTNLTRLSALSSSLGFTVPETRALPGHHFRAAIRAIGPEASEPILVEKLTTEAALSFREQLLLRPLPDQTIGEIKRIHRALLAHRPAASLCARSCFDGEDGSQNSFAGAFDTVLEAKTEEDLCRAVQVVYASVFSERALASIQRSGATELPSMSVAIQIMVGGAEWYGGVAHTQDVDLSPLPMMLISVSSDCANVTSGASLPEDYLVYRPNLMRDDRNVIVQRRAGSFTKTAFLFSDEQMRSFARTLLRIETAFGQPVEVEWQCSDDNHIYILQARPLPTVDLSKVYPLSPPANVEPLCTGLPVGTGAVTATVHCVDTVSQAKQVPPGCIIATHSTDPEWNPVVRGAAGLVSEVGARTSHVSRIAREEGVLAVVGCGSSINELRSGMTVTLVCHEALGGDVFKGHVELGHERAATDTLQIDRPAEALTLSRLHKPKSVILDLSSTLWSIGLPEKPTYWQQDNERLKRRYAGFGSLEQFVVSRYVEAITWMRFAFPMAKILVILHEQLDWHGAIHAAIQKSKKEFGIEATYLESSCDQARSART